MRSFLLKEKKPICSWGSLPQDTLFQGKVPEGYQLAVNPSNNYIVVDIDRHGDKNGFDNIPLDILDELEETFNYPTKNNGIHYWLKYTGDKPLINKPSGLSIDLRTNKGYAVWYSEENINDSLTKMKETSSNLNNWLEGLFSYKILK